MKVISVTTVVTETIETDEHSMYRRAGPEQWAGLRGSGAWESLYPSRARELEAAYQVFKERWGHTEETTDKELFDERRADYSAGIAG